MTRADLIALAARVEQAQGPDRELDFAVAAALGWPDSPITHQNARRYTENLDAALTLYGERPPRLIETDPRRACRDALVWLAEQAP